MSDTPPFSFSQFVPGFDFLKNLAAGSAAAPGSGKSAMPGLPGMPNIPGLSSWIAPTLSVEEVDKRIKELKTVQFWLEQNLYALKATIQALEVQKMTLSTLRGMNVRMEDLANVFTSAATAATTATTAKAEAPAPEPVKEKEKPRSRFSPPAPEPEVEEVDEAEDENASDASASAGKGGLVDPTQWWGALTQQFQEIATTALSDAANLKMPTVLKPKAAKKAAPAKKKPAAKKASATRSRAAAPARRR